MTRIQVITGSKAEATAIADQFGGKVSRHRLLRWKVQFSIDGDVDLDAFEADARELGWTVRRRLARG